MTKVLKRLNIVKAAKERAEIDMDNVGGKIYTYIDAFELADAGKAVIKVITYQGQEVEYEKAATGDSDNEARKNAVEDYNKVMKDVEKLALKFNKDMEALMKRTGYKLRK